MLLWHYLETVVNHAKMRIHCTFLFTILAIALVCSEPTNPKNDKDELSQAMVIEQEQSIGAAVTLDTINTNTEAKEKLNSRVKRGRASNRLKIRRKLNQRYGKTFGNNVRL